MKIILIFILIQILDLYKSIGIYIIKNLYNNYFYLKENKLILSNEQTNFRLIIIKENLYYIETKHSRKKIGVNINNEIIKYNYEEIIKNENKIIWKIIKTNENEYFIQNLYNEKYIETNGLSLQCYKNINNLFKYPTNNKIFNNFKYIFIHLVDEAQLDKKYMELINNEAIDAVIKYIDLSDKTLKREGINQIYKDNDNEELRYCLRSILQYMPWIRYIFILMPNNKVRFLKPVEEIRNKIIYIKDKDLLGFESANIHSFTFQLYKLDKFGISKNFIYMEDDFFVGKPLNKKDFFFYDKERKKVLPYLLTKYFQELTEYQLLPEYYELFKNKDSIHPHSYDGWWLSIYCTDKYFLDKYNNSFINTNFTHNAIAENIDELKKIFEEIKNYEFFNETIYSKERYILTLNQPHFLNIYQLNINHKKVHTLPYKYIQIEKLKNQNLDLNLFVINTGGNHKPTERQNKIQKKIMEKRFPFQTEYENKYNDFYFNQNCLKLLFYIFSNLFIILANIKIIIFGKDYLFNIKINLAL